MADKTPKTDAYKGTHETHRINGKTIYDHAADLERKYNAACIPICIGKPIIQILAKEGQWISENGNGLIAADCLFGKDPYIKQDEVSETLTLALQDHDRLLQENHAMREAIKEAYTVISFMNELHSDGHSETANYTLNHLKPFLL